MQHAQLKLVWVCVFLFVAACSSYSLQQTTLLLSPSRRQLIKHAAFTVFPTTILPKTALAAPPMAVIAEELGYFPITDQQTSETIYVPQRITSKSTPQAIDLAKHLQSQNAMFFGTFWCPHCRNQRTFFGEEAFKFINYVECDPRGYNYDKMLADKYKINEVGFPSWLNLGHDDKIISGEMDLVTIAKLSSFPLKFNPQLEFATEQSIIRGASCKL